MMRRGIVVEVHPEDHSVDLVMADNGERLIGVQVMTSNGSTRSGTVDLPEIPKRDNKWDVSQQTGQDMLATVGYVGRHPVVVGFLYPQINQMLHKDPKLRVSRHQSDVVTSIDGDGNIQLQHPGGFYVRIGEGPDPVDLSGKNADASMAVDRNTGKRVHLRIGMAGGAAEITITPGGAISIKTTSTVAVEATGAASVKAQSVTIDTPQTHITGNVTVDGDVVASGISLVHHKHGGVLQGGALTAPPV